VPIPVFITRHESARMSFRIGSFHSIGIDVALHTHWIISFRIMTGHAALDIPACLFCMLTAAGANSKRHKTCEFMARRYRSAKGLASVRVAIAAERLGLMTHLAIRCSSSGIDAVREAIVKIVHHLTLQRLRFVIAKNTRRDHSTLFSARECCQIRTVVALGAEVFSVAGRTLSVKCSEPCKFRVVLDKIANIVRGGTECCKISVAGFTGIRGLDIIVARRACCHRRHVRLRRVLNLVDAGVACGAFHFLIAGVHLVIEMNIARFTGKTDRRLLIDMTISAGLAYLLFVAGLTNRMTGDHLVR